LNFPVIGEQLKFLEDKIEKLGIEWLQFYKRYLMVLSDFETPLAQDKQTMT